MPVVHAFDPPERFVAGTVGEPGSRTFFLQARTGARIVTIALEKQQVALLAERIDELLDEVMESAATLVPAVAPYALDDNGPLEQPIAEEFRAGTMTLAWDPSAAKVVIEVFPVDDGPDGPDDDDDADLDDDSDDDEEHEPSEMLLVRLDPAPARAFVKRAGLVVEAGRPSCPFCGMPIDPEGHLCVRANGFKRRDPLADRG
jgi:uncharacterized repeat protein (TIGR03847 family)